MTVVTVTLNPALDQTVRVEHFTPNAVNRVHSLQVDAGGKGVNVAAFLADYGITGAVTGFLGAENPQLFEQLFAAKGLADHFVRLPGATRTNLKIIDPVNQQTTDINMAGLTPSAAALAELRETVARLAETYEWFVLSGNLPPGAPAEIYADLIELLKARGRHTVLDTSGAALRVGLQAGPTLVKPNRDELGQILGRPLADLDAVHGAARELLAIPGLERVVVSMGAHGALFVEAGAALVARPPAVTVASTVGAGDAMVAGLVAGRLQGLDLAESARLATAFSVGAITRWGHSLAPAADLATFWRQVALLSCDQAAQLLD